MAETLIDRVWETYWMPDGFTAEALQRVVAIVLKDCADIAEAAYDEAPRGSYDNGGTQDGWQMACNVIVERIRAIPNPPHAGGLPHPNRQVP